MPIAGKKDHADIFSNQIIVFSISSMCFENLQRPGNNIGIPRQEAITLILSAANTFPARNAENAVSIRKRKLLILIVFPKSLHFLRNFHILSNSLCKSIRDMVIWQYDLAEQVLYLYWGVL